MQGTTHEEAQELLGALVDGELSLPLRRAVAMHVSYCARCQRDLAEQREIARALGREKIPAASLRLRNRIRRLTETLPTGKRRE